MSHHASNQPKAAAIPGRTRWTRRAVLAAVCALVIEGNRANQKAELWRSAADGSQINNNGMVRMLAGLMLGLGASLTPGFRVLGRA